MEVIRLPSSTLRTKNPGITLKKADAVFVKMNREAGKSPSVSYAVIAETFKSTREASIEKTKKTNSSDQLNGGSEVQLAFAKHQKVISLAVEGLGKLNIYERQRRSKSWELMRR